MDAWLRCVIDRGREGLLIGEDEGLLIGKKLMDRQHTPIIRCVLMMGDVVLY